MSRRVTFASIFDAAKKNGWKASSAVAAVGVKTNSRLQLGTIAEREFPFSPYVVKNMLYEGESVGIVAPPGIGKTAFMVHIAVCIARGVPCFGQPVQRGHVVIIAAEAERSTGRRLKNALDPESAALVHLVTGVSTYLDQNGEPSPDAKATGDLVEEIDPVFIGGDTIAAMFVGGDFDENAAGSMARVAASMSWLRGRGSGRACVAYNHHPAKNGGGFDPRGSGALRGALDVLIGIEKASDVGGDTGRRAVVVKARDGEEGRVFGYSIEGVVIDRDADGDPITTAHVVELEGTPKHGPRLSPGEKRARDVLRDLPDATTRTDGTGGVQLGDWLVACEVRGVSDAKDKDSRRKVVRRIIDGLIKKEVVVDRGGLFSLTGPDPGLVFETVPDDDGGWE